jgi:hypothetical protein
MVLQRKIPVKLASQKMAKQGGGGGYQVQCPLLTTPINKGNATSATFAAGHPTQLGSAPGYSFKSESPCIIMEHSQSYGQKVKWLTSIPVYDPRF